MIALRHHFCFIWRSPLIVTLGYLALIFNVIVLFNRNTLIEHWALFYLINSIVFAQLQCVEPRVRVIESVILLYIC